MPNVSLSGFIPSLRTLRSIAKYIGILCIEDTIEFLEDCGIPHDQLTGCNDSKKAVYHAFKKLTSSGKEDDFKLLEKIISESINPALFDQPKLTEQKILETYNEWLKSDRLCLTRYKDEYTITSYIPPSAELEKITIADTEFEKDLLTKFVEPYLKDIAEIKFAYSLLLQIVNVFSQKSYPIDQNFNDYYRKLFIIVKEKIDFIHSKIAEIYEKENPTESAPSFYIHPFIFLDDYGKPVLFQPFTNLYLAEKEMKQQHVSWEDIKKQMDKCYGFIEDNYFKFSANKVTDLLPYQKFFDEISAYLKQSIKINYRDYFGFEGTKFWLKRMGAENLVISFHPDEGETSDSLSLIHAYVDYLQKFGKPRNGWLSAIIPREEIIAYIRTKYPKTDPLDWNRWVTNSKHNLLQIMTTDDKKFIIFGDWDRKNNGYPISIKLPLNHSFTP